MKTQDENTAYCIELIRDQDLDRYYLSLFVPDGVRNHIWAILAFNAEVSKIPSIVSEPMLGEIRLQWWREAFDSIDSRAPRAHPVVGTLSALPDFSAVRNYLEEILDAWSAYFASGNAGTLADIEKHAEQTGGALNAALLHVYGDTPTKEDIAIVRQAGKIWAFLGAIRGLPHALVNSGVQHFDTGTELAGNLEIGGSSQQTAEALMPTLKRLAKTLDTELADMKRGQRPNKAVGTLLAINSLSGLYLSELKRAEFDALKMREGRPGNARKLFALCSFHLFG